jgi:hypothetical protein
MLLKASLRRRSRARTGPGRTGGVPRRTGGCPRWFRAPGRPGPEAFPKDLLELVGGRAVPRGGDLLDGVPTVRREGQKHRLLGLKGPGEAAKRAELHAHDAAVLEARDDRLVDAADPLQVALTPATPQPPLPDQLPDRGTAARLRRHRWSVAPHGRIEGGAPSHALTAACIGASCGGLARGRISPHGPDDFDSISAEGSFLFRAQAPGFALNGPGPKGPISAVAPWRRRPARQPRASGQSSVK